MEVKSNNYTILLAICSASFITPFSVSTMNIITPDLALYFSANAVLLAWMNTIFFLAAGMVLMPAAKLCDIFGRHRVFTFGVSCFAVSAFVAAASVNVWMLLACRFVQGMAAACLMGPSMAITAAVFPANQRGKALSFTVGAVYLGHSLGPFIGGWLAHTLSWRSVFVVLGLWSILSFILLKITLKGEWKTDETLADFDWQGTLVYCIGIIALLVGATHLPSMRASWLVIGGIMALVAFFIWEKDLEKPVFDVTIFTRFLGFSFNSVAALLHYSALTANTLLLSLYLQYILGYDSHMAGILLLPQPITMLITTLIFGRLSDKTNPSYLASFGAVMAFAASLMLCMSDHLSLHFILVCQIIIGCGYGAFVSPNTNMVLSSVSKDRLNEASSVVGTMRLLGQVLSLGIISTIFAIVIGRVEILPEVYPKFVTSFRVAYLIFAVLCICVLALSLPWKFKNVMLEKRQELIESEKNDEK